MANYYHEARAHNRRLKEMQEENKRRAELRAEVTGAHVGGVFCSLQQSDQYIRVQTFRISAWGMMDCNFVSVPGCAL